MYLAHHAVKVLAQFVDIDPFACRDENAGRIRFGDPAVFQLVERHIFLRGRGQVVFVLLDERIGVEKRVFHQPRSPATFPSPRRSVPRSWGAKYRPHATAGRLRGPRRGSI